MLINEKNFRTSFERVESNRFLLFYEKQTRNFRLKTQIFLLTRDFFDRQNFERVKVVRWRVQRKFERQHYSMKDIEHIRGKKRSKHFDRSDVEHRLKISNNRL